MAEALAVDAGEDSSAKWGTMAVVVLGTLVISFNTTILNISLPKIMSSLRVDVDEIRWVVAGYMITMAIMMPTVGWLGSRFGNKSVFIGGLVLFTFGSILSGMAWNVDSLVFFRVLQGIGAGPITPLGMVILYEAFPRHQRGFALGVYTLGMTLGPAIGPTLGGWIVEHHSWRLIFYFNVPIAAAGVFLGSMMLEGTQEKQRRPLDSHGVLLLAFFLVALMVALSQGNIEGWASSYILILFLVAAVSGALLVLREVTTAFPLVELRVFRIRNFSLLATVAIINDLGMMGTFFLISIFLQRVLGLSPLHAGLFTLPTALTMGGTSVVTGRLSDKMNPKYLMISGLCMRVVAFYLLSTINTFTGLGVVLAVLMFRSFSNAWIVTPLSNAAMQTLPPELYRHGSGLLSLMRGIGASLGIAITTTMLSYKVSWNTISSLQAVDGSSISIREAMRNLNQHLVGAGESASLIQTKSLLLIARQLLDQAILIGYQETFLFLGVLLALAIVPGLFIRLPGPGVRRQD